MASIIFEKGVDKGSIYSLEGYDLVLFGRGEHCQIIVRDPLASRAHFTIEVVGGKCMLLDQESYNGTYVNGERANNVEINYGDQIAVGNTVMTFVKDEIARQKGGLFGQILGGYLIESRLGTGGMGTVYKAQQLSIGRPVALKVLSERFAADREFVALFTEEARSVGRLCHPCLAAVHDVGEDQGRFFYSMEYLEGGSLEDLLNYTDRLPPASALKLVIDATRGLEYLRKERIVHRDIKPENLMLDGEGNVKIVDLGIAIDLEKTYGMSGGVYGTPHYMAPEQVLGQVVDHRTDLYALGCTLYRMLSGRFPFVADNEEAIMDMQLNAAADPLRDLVPDVPSELCAVVQRMMEKSPDDRYENGAETLVDLQLCMAEEIKRQDFAVQPTIKSQIMRAIPKTSRFVELGNLRANNPVPEKMRVLVVDDEKIAISAIRHSCQGIGYEVSTATSGEEAMRVFRQEEIDLVITDRMMPEMSGDELAAKLKSLSPSLPILMLTSLGSVMQKKGELPDAVDLVLSKPTSVARLKTAIQLVNMSAQGFDENSLPL
ncbi:MAG: protein kinase [Planctomycetota bacterium]|jgi:serine/threonine protein kinase|nr:protein kinase [Planctomycetota bacterium]